MAISYAALALKILTLFNPSEQKETEFQRQQESYLLEVQSAVSDLNQAKFAQYYPAYVASKPSKQALEELHTFIDMNYNKVMNSTPQDYARIQKNNLAISVPITIGIGAISRYAFSLAKDIEDNGWPQDSYLADYYWDYDLPLWLKAFGVVAATGAAYGIYYSADKASKWWHAKNEVEKQKLIVEFFMHEKNKTLTNSVTQRFKELF
jgi:hypothetical protein